MLDAVILDLGNVLAFHDTALLFERLAAAFGTTPVAMSARLEKDLWERCNTGRLPGESLRAEIQKSLGGEVSPSQFVALWNCHFTLNHAMVKKVETSVAGDPRVHGVGAPP